YLVFEPDALDERDALFSGQSEFGANEAGRFAIYWARDEQELHFETMSEELLNDTTPGSNGIPYNRWYSCPLEQRQVCVIDPYLDEVDGVGILMTSIAFPLLRDGKPVAVFGVARARGSRQGRCAAASGRSDGGQGSSGVGSTAGVLAGHSGDAGLLGKGFDAACRQSHLLQGIAAGRRPVQLRGQSIQVLYPFAPI